MEEDRKFQKQPLTAWVLVTACAGNGLRYIKASTVCTNRLTRQKHQIEYSESSYKHIREAT